MTTAVCGIDPGLSGAVALLTDDDLRVHDLPILNGRVDGYALRDIICDFGHVRCVAVESASIRPGESGTSGLTIGTNFGVILGVLMCLDRPIVHVSPQRWVSGLNLPRGGKTPAEKRRAKEARVARAKETWPAHADLFSGPRGGAKDGRADSALIALWCARSDERGAA